MEMTTGIMQHYSAQLVNAVVVYICMLVYTCLLKPPVCTVSHQEATGLSWAPRMGTNVGPF